MCVLNRPHSESCDAECLNGQLRESNATINVLLDYCYGGEWRKICCREDSQWDTDMSVAACTELGYSDSGKSSIRMDKITLFFILEITTIGVVCQENPLKLFFLSNCNEPGLTNCTVMSIDSDTCDTSCSIVSLRTCITGWS